MYCSHCGKEQPDDATKCMYCGKQLVTGTKDSDYRCTSCKEDVSRPARFCWNCGAKFEGFSDSKNYFERYFWILVFMGVVGLLLYRIFRSAGSLSVQILYLVGVGPFVILVIILLYITRKQWLRMLYGIVISHSQASRQHSVKKPSSPEEMAAKQFFINRIITQVEKEGISLSPAEKYMLNFSESDSSFHIDPKKIDDFENEIPEDEYEHKIATLIRSAYKYDINNNKRQRSVYQKHYQNIQKGDHYICIMIDMALGTHLDILEKKIF